MKQVLWMSFRLKSKTSEIYLFEKVCFHVLEVIVGFPPNGFNGVYIYVMFIDNKLTVYVKQPSIKCYMPRVHVQNCEYTPLSLL